MLADNPGVGFAFARCLPATSGLLLQLVQFSFAMALGTSTPYHLDPKATYFVLCCVATLALCLLISIWHG